MSIHCANVNPQELVISINNSKEDEREGSLVVIIPDSLRALMAMCLPSIASTALGKFHRIWNFSLTSRHSCGSVGNYFVGQLCNDGFRGVSNERTYGVMGNTEGMCQAKVAHSSRQESEGDACFSPGFRAFLKLVSTLVRRGVRRFSSS